MVIWAKFRRQALQPDICFLFFSYCWSSQETKVTLFYFSKKQDRWGFYLFVSVKQVIAGFMEEDQRILRLNHFRRLARHSHVNGSTGDVTQQSVQPSPQGEGSSNAGDQINLRAIPTHQSRLRRSVCKLHNSARNFRDFPGFQRYCLPKPNDNSLFLRGGRLFQQYVVDNYVNIDSSRLRWYRQNQSSIRAELYQGLQHALNVGESNAANVGRLTILPSSYIGSPRDMYQRYQDAMALVQKFGKPDLFITMTCNPGWEEITEQLLSGQTAQDRPDLYTRVFLAKYEELKKDIYEDGVLGKVDAHVHVIEFQKRGLPHVHMLIIFSEEDKLSEPDDYDQIVRAKIPYRDEEPELYNAVLKWMIHGPCGIPGSYSPCMKHGPCKQNFPKSFSPFTVQGNDSFPLYRRRDDGRCILLDVNSDVTIDNRWVVPYNPRLLRKYDCHINVEVCSTIASVMYLYKYVYKGPDHVALEV